ncbi:hypothetical protein SAMN06265222_11341 [Neorhodopirellula lusitana]|uniref:Uncharacterized protein n=1 Tax=Neorhodopirellula lusitana TaxID=445327 RepID=A0ABY1QG84_9BACT|nr:hypothetical protein [Neorhodopirellula lusitana]SMP70417.1 hypothetical protein SAMN06265222_11341 [Neorhodopirellula lusitana]
MIDLFKKNILERAAVLHRFTPKMVLCLLAVPAVWAMLVSGGSSAAADRMDWNSIGLTPAYLSVSAFRESATLHAGEFAPGLGQPEPSPRLGDVNVAGGVQTGGVQQAARVGIVVGDGGTILRTDDGGKTWLPIDQIYRSDDELAARPVAFGAKRKARRSWPIPFWHFYDLAWLSPVDVVVIGGSFEPVTGISRGVCLFSSDAGQTWSLGDANEMPRLVELVRPADSVQASSPVIEAIGDAAEASGVNHFFSHDGGRTWVEDTVVRTSTRTDDHGRLQPDRTARGDLAVGRFGAIWVRESEVSTGSSPNRSHWRAVRGDSRHAAVAFVIASASTAPWSVIGRESLHEHLRVSVAIDPMLKKTSGATSVDRIVDAAKGLGVASCEELRLDAQGRSRDGVACRLAWLNEHRPSVVALDSSLPTRTREAWLNAIAQARNSTRGATPFPQRVVITRRGGDSDANPGEMLTTDAAIWRRSSILRSDALMTDPACLAGDFALDALMMCEPGTGIDDAVEVTTLDDQSGSIRRDISLAAGVRLAVGQRHSETEIYHAAHRRLQIATARATQSSRLRGQLTRIASTGRSGGELAASDERAVQQAISGVLAVTAAEDRTRLLWDAFVRVSQSPETSSAMQDLMLKELASNASPASIRRWATWALQTRGASVERHFASQARLAVSKWSGAQLAGVPLSNSRSADALFAGRSAPENQQQRFNGESAGHSGDPGDAPEVMAVSHSDGRAVSPFQVAPASYESSYASSVAPTTILVPQAKNTVWQTTPRWNAQSVPGQANTGSSDPRTGSRLSQSSLDDESMQRLNWDYHPVIMAGRRVDVGDSSKPSRVATGVWLNPSDRPYLDGLLTEVCWRNAKRLELDQAQLRHAVDADFDYFGITLPVNEELTQREIILRLDCDGDYLTTIDLKLASDGRQSASVDGAVPVAIQWHAARSSDSCSVEFAVLKADLPASVQRARCDVLTPAEVSSIPVIPHAANWLNLP